MSTLNEVQDSWDTPDGLTIVTTKEFIQMFDASGDPVIESISKECALEIIDNHIEAQKNQTAIDMLMAVFWKPIEA
jgi:hypothetical protein